MLAVKNYKFWFCTGSQDLYGDECLANVAAHSKEIVAKLNESGVLPFEDKASPEVIRREFGLSKNAFKRAIGHLLKEGKIQIKDRRIYLVK